MWDVEIKTSINSGSVKRKFMRENRHKPLVLRPSCVPEKVGANKKIFP
jgi:hypothetical protein